jgi:hypothetical protein
MPAGVYQKQKKGSPLRAFGTATSSQRRVRETLLLPNNKTKNYEKLIKLLKQLMNIMD